MSNRINPWEHKFASEVNWRGQSNYFTWIRGQLRRIWSDNPLRKVWKKQQLRPVTKEEKEFKRFHPSTKNVGECYLCKDVMAGSKLEVDHIVGEISCIDYKTAEEFLWHCAADNPDNWALVCKPCHKIKSHAERYGISFEEARAEKQAIQIEKEKRVNEFLEDNGVEPESNAKKRRQQMVKVIMEKNNDQ